nr:glycosyltransferase [Pseudofrankia asymbiotica]
MDVLIPTCGRPEALAVTLAGLANQTHPEFRVVISDQTPAPAPAALDAPAVVAMLRQLRHRGHEVETHRRRARRGMAEQRQFLLDRAAAPAVLCLDDDIFLEAPTLGRMRQALGELGCGFVGAAPQGLSYLDDVRPAEHESFEPVIGAVVPERVRKGKPGWERWRLHNAANLAHLTARLADQDAAPAARSGPGSANGPDLGRDGAAAAEWVAYKVAWVAGCVLYDRAALVEAGGFAFWRRLPTGHRGEEIVAQLRVMERRGGVGLLPSGAVHLELPTSVVDRTVDAYAAIVEADEAPPDRSTP